MTFGRNNMSLIISIVPLLLLIVLPSLLLKVASVITRIRTLWRHCFLYGGLVTAISIASNVLFSAFKYTPSLTLALLCGGLLHLAIGSWYLRTLARSKDGGRIQVSRAVITMLAFILILSLLAGGLLLLTTIPRPPVQE